MSRISLIISSYSSEIDMVFCSFLRKTLVSLFMVLFFFSIAIQICGLLLQANLAFKLCLLFLNLWILWSRSLSFPAYSTWSGVAGKACSFVACVCGFHLASFCSGHTFCPQATRQFLPLMWVVCGSFFSLSVLLIFSVVS